MRREGPKLILFGEFLMDTRKAELFRNGARVPLQKKPFELLLALLDHAGQVVSRASLCQQLWPDGALDRQRSLDTAVKKARLALSASSAIAIETVPGSGYRLNAGAGLVILPDTRFAPDVGRREASEDDLRAAS